jgi:hypothetical protein
MSPSAIPHTSNGFRKIAAELFRQKPALTGDSDTLWAPGQQVAYYRKPLPDGDVSPQEALELV